MCGVCVSVQGGSVAPSLYVAGFAAVGAVGWQRFRALLPTRSQLEGHTGDDDAAEHDDAALDDDADRSDAADELVLAGLVGDVGDGPSAHRSPRRASRSD